MRDHSTSLEHFDRTDMKIIRSSNAIAIEVPKILFSIVTIDTSGILKELRTEILSA